MVVVDSVVGWQLRQEAVRIDCWKANKLSSGLICRITCRMDMNYFFKKMLPIPVS